MEYLKKLNFKIAMLLLLGLVSPFVSPSVAMPIALLCFTGIFVMDRWFQENQKEDPNIELRNEISHIKNMMSGMIIKNSTKPEEVSREFKKFF
jgi:uncharacterized protein YneF (UPF0154 family)